MNSKPSRAVSFSGRATLPLFSRLLFLAMQAVSLAVSAGFFYWVQNQCALPRFTSQKSHLLPLLELRDAIPLPGLLVWNFALFALFGIVHTFTAQTKFQNWLSLRTPPQTIRTLYVFFTAVMLSLVIGFWQNTGIILWNMGGHANADGFLNASVLRTFDLVVYWSGLALALGFLAQFSLWSFLGLKQLYSQASAPHLTQKSGVTQTNNSQTNDPQSVLITTGIRKFIRHPVYTFTLLAFFLTTQMSLDRFILCVAIAIYLKFAIPIEEQKLIDQFGDTYRDYQNSTGSLFPRLSRLKQNRSNRAK